jgi:hypothetical protein
MIKPQHYEQAARVRLLEILGQEKVEDAEQMNQSQTVEDANGGAWVLVSVFVADAEALAVAELDSAS